jgi:hypothetical protein
MQLLIYVTCTLLSLDLSLPLIGIYEKFAIFVGLKPFGKFPMRNFGSQD